jgi:hypothetical protein
MSLGLVVFIAGDALGAAGAVISCRRTSRYRGRGAAAREAVVLGVSLAVYTGMCLAFGFGFWPQLAGCLFGGVVAVAGRPWVLPRAELFTKGDD